MTRRSLNIAGLVLAGGILTAVWGFAAEVAFTNPEKAGPDFAVQGEYEGQVDGKKLGLQVVALGEGKFQAVLLPGGLPGEGWDRKTRIALKGRTASGETPFAGETPGWTGTIKEGRFRGQTGEGRKFSLRKVLRTSPNLNQKAPSGSRVLFDGRGTDAWVNPRLTEEGNLREGVQTRENFGDFTLHVEFRTPFMPRARGQGRGNSGVFLDGRYEIQILDSFGLEGRNNECGGLYSVKAPDVNMCLPPLSWQTYDIDFAAPRFDASGRKTRNAVVTVRHNGVLIHDRVEVPRNTAGGQEGPARGPIQLMNHGDPVHFRNVWIIERK